MPPLKAEQVAAWAEYQGAPWGRLRLDLLRAILARHVPKPMRVLDVGCGFGELAVEFARNGSQVVAADASAPMIAEAAARAADAPVHWIALEAERAAAHFASQEFDLILCHNVLGYLSDPAGTCLGLASLLSNSGSLSITVVNRVAEPLRYAFLLRDLDAALAAAEHDDPSRMAETLGVESRLESLDDAAGWLEASGLQLQAAAGQLLVNHYLGATDKTKNTSEGYDAIFRLELALCERDPYRQVAPFLHLIARRPQS